MLFVMLARLRVLISTFVLGRGSRQRQVAGQHQQVSNMSPQDSVTPLRSCLEQSPRAT